jgi:hypothetical protein
LDRCGGRITFTTPTQSGTEWEQTLGVVWSSLGTVDLEPIDTALDFREMRRKVG